MTKITLATPIEYNGKTYTELTFREAETGDLMVADKFEGETSKTVAMLASMCDVPLPAFRKIKVRELSRIMKEVSNLLGESEASPATTGE